MTVSDSSEILGVGVGTAVDWADTTDEKAVKAKTAARLRISFGFIAIAKIRSNDTYRSALHNSLRDFGQLDAEVLSEV